MSSVLACFLRQFVILEILGNFTVTSWKPIILDVIASFSRTIFKRRECFSRLNVFTVECLLELESFPVYKPFFGVIFLMVQKSFQIQQEVKNLEITLATPF